MKAIILLLTVILSTQFEFAHAQNGLYKLPSEYDSGLENICFKAQTQYAMDYDVSNKNLEDIYQALNFYGNRIEVIVCNGIHSSALAYLNPEDGKKYILINSNRLQNINNQYYAHLFVIAHEFAHHILNHFGSAVVPTQANKRRFELQADSYAAALVKKLGGTRNDCLLALDNMSHPTWDENSDHPTKSKRVQAVYEGFGESVIDTHVTHSTYIDLFSKFMNVSLTKYPNGISPMDISYYYKQTGMYPKSILYFNNAYWIYWEKNSSLENYAVRWNYDYFPADEIQKYFDKGYNIEFLEKVNGKWFVFLLKYNKYFFQKTRVVSKKDFYDHSGKYSEIKSSLAEGYCIQNMIEDGDNFQILLTKLNGDGYSWATRFHYEDFEKWYKSETDEGFNYMYSYKYIDGVYFGFMLKSQTVSSWSVVSFDGQNIENVIKYVDEGYVIDNITADYSGMRFTVRK